MADALSFVEHMQTQKAEEDLHILLPDNPFVPPKGDVCFIKNLPPELLSRIFEAGCEDDDEIEDEDEIVPGFSEDEDREGDEETDDATGSSNAPLPSLPFQALISRVCHQWHRVATSTPSLWTTIVVTPKAYPPYPLESTWLARSKSLPVDISVECQLKKHKSYAKGPFDENLRYLFPMLSRHIHRWCTVEISVSEYHHMYEFLNAVSDPSIPAARQLTTLRLYYHRNSKTEEFDPPSMSKHLSIFAGSAPSLTMIFLWGVHVDWSQPWIASASKLTDLHLKFHTYDVRPSWTQFASILRGAPALERLSLCQSGPSGDPAEWFIEPTPGSPTDLNAPIHLPRLTYFFFWPHSQAHAIGLLRKLCLPSLRRLVLRFVDGDYTDLVHELVSQATCLSPAQGERGSLLSGLKRLDIAGLPCRTECIEVLYDELQHLTCLNLALSVLPARFLDILCMPCTLEGRGNVWLPRLTTLRVSGTSGLALREVVRTRRDLGVPLDELQVDKWCELCKDDATWLKANVETLMFFDGF